jgi:hypothetical protein
MRHLWLIFYFSTRARPFLSEHVSMLQYSSAKILNKYSHLEVLYGSTAIRQQEHGHSINETAQSSSQVRKQVFHCHSPDYFNVLAALPRSKNFHEKILINTIMLYHALSLLRQDLFLHEAIPESLE